LEHRDGGVGWGEIAPLPGFGSETLEEAIAFCRDCGDTVTDSHIDSIPDRFRASQFGFEMAREQLVARGWHPPQKLISAQLLPTGSAALSELENNGKGAFKWKIGVSAIDRELAIFERLLEKLSPGATLRLDANGGLTWEEANQWLQECDAAGIEFLEQPLPPREFEAMRQLSDRYRTPIALDESVATLSQLQECYHRGWRSIAVIKAAIAGSPSRLRQFCHNCAIDTVFSSVFETEIGRNAALSLASELQRHPYAVGFGTTNWFADGDPNWLDKLWKTG
jgi:O-succinylbenzoate synthase